MITKEDIAKLRSLLNGDISPVLAKHLAQIDLSDALDTIEDNLDTIAEIEAGRTQAARDVLAERQRQIEVEGYDADYDNGSVKHELSFAAVSYIAFGKGASDERLSLPPSTWPWAKSLWKPKNRRADLVRAGALIIAEIDRLDRNEAVKKGDGK